MKGGGKPKFNRTTISQNTGAMSFKALNSKKFQNKQRNNKKELIDKLLKRKEQ